MCAGARTRILSGREEAQLFPVSLQAQQEDPGSAMQAGRGMGIRAATGCGESSCLLSAERILLTKNSYLSGGREGHFCPQMGPKKKDMEGCHRDTVPSYRSRNHQTAATALEWS